jgi:adenosylcobinamide-GDP ribazoletransferase
MKINLDQTHWYDRIWASLIFFTRLPFWRLHEPPRECYQTVVEHWPLAGWLTGGAMAATLWFGSQYLPYAIAVLLAITIRLLLTVHSMKMDWPTSSTVLAEEVPTGRES